MIKYRYEVSAPCVITDFDLAFYHAFWQYPVSHRKWPVYSSKRIRIIAAKSAKANDKMDTLLLDVAVPEGQGAEAIEVRVAFRVYGLRFTVKGLGLRA